jgi:hypothetical protein
LEQRENSQIEELPNAPSVVDPPGAKRVAARALALTAVTVRAILEQDADSVVARDTHRELLAWIEQIGIGDELEPDEWQVLQRGLGKFDEGQQVDSTWRLEGLVVLARALGRFDLPPHDVLVNVEALWQAMGFLDARAARALLARPTLRSREEIGIMRNRLLALHWRLRKYCLDRTVIDFAKFARTCWFGPLDVTDLPLVDGDLALGGRRLDRVPQDDLLNAASASLERYQAASWLWEGPRIYSRALLDT